MLNFKQLRFVTSHIAEELTEPFLVAKMDFGEDARRSDSVTS